MILCFMLTSDLTAYAASHSVSGISRSNQISQEQFDQILNTLRQMKDNIPNGNYDFYDTGIRCGSCEEAEAMIHCFDELFLADDEFILYYNEAGWKRLYVEPAKNENGGYTYWKCGKGGAVQAILAVWRPDANATELLRQHDEAKKVIDALLAEAPEAAYDKVKYFNDVLSGRITYDMEGYNTGCAKHSPYYGLVEGTCVCTGYSEAFFTLCYYSGITCAATPYVSAYSVDGTPDHKVAIVNLDGRWKMVDVTWNDVPSGVRYDYFMVDMGDEWQQLINGPYLLN